MNHDFFRQRRAPEEETEAPDSGPVGIPAHLHVGPSVPTFSGASLATSAGFGGGPRCGAAPGE